MIAILAGLAGLTIVGPAKVPPPPVAAPVEAAPLPSEPTLVPYEAVMRVVRWVTSAKDNRALPWAVVDKSQAALFLFDGKGQPLAAVPVLIGIASGDEASPGVGNKKLADLGPAEKTTPAGRFLAKFGLPVGGERVLWVDYATSVALHPIPRDAAAGEQRRARMLSPDPGDNRITFGCINVPKAFYSRSLRPLFRGKGGYVYVLPDSKPLEEVFPRLRVYAP
ncbi:hypothetical protein GCM10011380_26970 [Sphingomonas metalli]|uniref:L,D-transpeptidase n=1 Tax=Sphingomonas metalli TaxID=1779358 RepID=A0A916WWL7_9SPHN|nr:hypothetical protein [Sphingomonas metalli]GGB36192.1 hypothetical protein GCM10011380_26970 [Sphingomonas metalli]